MIYFPNHLILLINSSIEQVQCQPPGYVPKTLSHQSVASEVTTPTDERTVAVAPAAPVTDGAVPASTSPLPPAPAANPPLQSQPSRDGGILGKSPLPSSVNCHLIGFDGTGGTNPFLTNRRPEEGGAAQSATSAASAAGNLARSFFSRSSSQQLQEGGGDDGEDTMKNLRKTFAGIFGDM